MIYQINEEKNDWIYETRTKEFGRIEVGFEIDEEDNEKEITIYSICLIKTDDPKVNENGIPYQSGATHRLETFRFINEETIKRLVREIKVNLSRKTWDEVMKPKISL